MNQEEPPSANLPASGLMQAWLLPFQATGEPKSRVSLMDYFEEIRRRWKLVVISTLSCVAGAAAIAWLSTPIYRANTVVEIRSQSGSESLGRSLLSQLGGLASIAGISAGSGAADTEAYAVLQSREIAERFISANNLLPILFHKKWDSVLGRWRVLSDGPPTIADGYRYFSKKVLNISQDRKTGLVTLTIDWSDRELAANWANAFVRQADEALRERAMDESRATVEYLDEQLKTEQSVPIRQSLFQLLEAQQKSLVFAKTRREFAFRTIDPAVAPQLRDRIWPKRMIMVAVGALAGVLLSLTYVISAYSIRNARLDRAVPNVSSM